MRKFKVLALFIGFLFITVSAQAQTVKTIEPYVIGSKVSQEQVIAAPTVPAQEKNKSEEATKVQEADKDKKSDKNQDKKAEGAKDGPVISLEEIEKLLEGYGKWIETKEHGWVWVPEANQKESWGPYQDGEWSDYDQDQYRWHSYEPFGNIVYHYGRWQWSVLWGWYWIPGYVWGPAWVNWYYWGNYVYWSPMWVDGFDNWYFRTHYDRYYGRSGNQFWSVVKKDQLKSRNLSQAISASRKTKSVNIPSSKIQPNIRQARQPSANLSASQSDRMKTFSSNSSVSSPNRRTPVSDRTSIRPTNRTNVRNTKRSAYDKSTDNPWGTNLRNPQPPSRYSGARLSSPRTAPSRISAPNRSSGSRPNTIRSSGNTRTSAPRTSSAPRTYSAPRGTSARRK